MFACHQFRLLGFLVLASSLEIWSDSASLPTAAEVAGQLRESCLTSAGKPAAAFVDNAEFAAREIERRDLHGLALRSALEDSDLKDGLWLARTLLPQAASDGDAFVLLRWLRGVVNGLMVDASQQPSRADAVDRSALWLQPRRLSVSESEAAAAVAHLPEQVRLSALRVWLLRDYDFESRPTPPIKVDISIRFVKISGIDLQSSIMHTPVWFRLYWADDRLKWNPDAWNIKNIDFAADSYTLENSRIWVPDIELYNAATSLSYSLSLKKALVSSNGSVFWSRPGILQTLCKFEGLQSFPMDIMTCQLRFGSWSLDGVVQDIHMKQLDGGFTYAGKPEGDGSNVGSSFQVYKFWDIKAHRIEAKYDCCEELYPYVEYTIKIDRSTMFYVMKLIVPQVAMSFLSIFTYHMHPEMGERLGFGITLVLAVIATDIVATDFMPVCEEQLLINYVSWLAFFFCCLALAESGIVLTVYYLEAYEAQELLPTWCRRRAWHTSMRQQREAAEQRCRQASNLSRPPIFAALTQLQPAVARLFSRQKDPVSDFNAVIPDESLDVIVQEMNRGQSPGGSVPEMDREQTPDETTPSAPSTPKVPPPPGDQPPCLLHGIQPPGDHAEPDLSQTRPTRAVHYALEATEATEASHKASSSSSPKRYGAGQRTASDLMQEHLQAERGPRVPTAPLLSVSPPVGVLIRQATAESGGAEAGPAMTAAKTTNRAPSTAQQANGRLREQLYREAFYILDDDYSGLLERSEVNTFGEFMLGDDWNEEALDAFMQEADDDGSGGLSLEEFTVFCENVIIGGCDYQEMAYVQEMVKGFIAVTNTRFTSVKQRWRARAKKIDSFFKLAVPIVLVPSYIILFCMVPSRPPRGE